MTNAPLNPHEVLNAYVTDRLGRLGTVFGALSDELFDRLVFGLTEQLGAYMDCVPGARLKLGEVRIRQGKVRSFLLAEVTDRGAPLRLRDAMANWTADGDIPVDFVAMQNARKWRFIERYLSKIIEPLLKRSLLLLGEYYAARPGAQVQVGLIRLLEDVDRTHACVEFDDRTGGKVSAAEARTRYAVQ